MDRQQVENKIAKMFLEILKVANEYYPDRYFTISFLDGYIHFNNEFWEHEEGEGKIDARYKLKGGELANVSIREHC